MKKILSFFSLKVKNILCSISLLTVYIHDFWDYNKCNLNGWGDFNQDQLKGKILLLSHSIEKGMFFPVKKNNWGKKKIFNLYELLQVYIEEYGISKECVSAFNIISAYNNDDFSCKDDDILNIVAKIRTQYKDYLFDGIGGVKWVSKPNDFEKNSILYFFSSRASVREFSSLPITEEEIESAMDIAYLTPTACNRQTSRVYGIQNKELINLILSLQLGNQGWCDKANMMFLITGNISYFGGINERYQVYIDSGLFAMNFVWGLHLNHIASCFKMFVRNYKLQKEIVKYCNIPENEVPIVIIMAGHYKEEAIKDPISYRLRDSYRSIQ